MVCGARPRASSAPPVGHRARLHPPGTSNGWLILRPLRRRCPLDLPNVSELQELPGPRRDQQRHLDRSCRRCTWRASKRWRGPSARAIRRWKGPSRAVPTARTSGACRSWAVSRRGAAGMTENETKGVEVAALLHDIGKLAVPEHMSTSPGRLTPAEFQAIRAHHGVVGRRDYQGRAVSLSRRVRSSGGPSRALEWHGVSIRGSEGEAISARRAHPRASLTTSTPISSIAALSRPQPGRADAIAILQVRGRPRARPDPSSGPRFLRILPTLEAVPGTDAVSRVDCADRDCGRARTARRTADVSERQSMPRRAWVFHNISLATQEMRDAATTSRRRWGRGLGVERHDGASDSSKLSRLMPGSSLGPVSPRTATEDVLRCRVRDRAGRAGAA